MAKLSVSTLLLLLLSYFGTAQDSIRHRVILIGDAGQVNKQQQFVITDAASRVIPDHTTVLYLGNNVFPDGMASTGDAPNNGQDVLTSQFRPFRSSGATVWFLPGNYDWDRSGKSGL